MQKLKNGTAAFVSKMAIVAVLGVPAVISFLKPPSVAEENRHLAAFPERPDSWDGVLKYPAKLDAWINDHFGFRAMLVELNNQVRYTLFREFPTIQVIAGKHDRIFLAAHATTHEPYAAISLACGYQYKDTAGIANQVARFFSAFQKMGIDAKLLIAPSSPVIYKEDLPDWLADRCDRSLPPVPQILSSVTLDSAARASILYPIGIVHRIEQAAHVIPKSWFHWAGTGPKLIAEASLGPLWGIETQTAVALASKTERMPSDIAHLFPGVSLSSEVEVADYAASGVDACVGSACFPEIAAVASKLGDVSRYRNPKGPTRRLVLFSDSFGVHIAGWYSRFFSEVVHLSTNNLGQLDKTDVDALRRTFLHNDAKDHVLFLYHDGSVLAGRLEVDLSTLTGREPGISAKPMAK